METKKASLFQLAWPIFINSILGILLGFIDVFVLSKVSDLAASAISAACQITSVCSLIFSAICSAATILIAQYLGRGDREKVSRISALSIVLNVIAGIVISAIVFVFHNAFLQILGAKAELFDMASEYIRILAWGIVLDAYQSTVGSILYSHGKTKISMYISSSMGILNLGLNMVMVLGLFGFPRMEVSGAAIATIITKIVCVTLTSIVFFREIESINIFQKLKHVTKREVSRIFTLGIPSVFDSVNYSITQLIITGIIFRYLSQDEIIARTYLMNIAAFFNLLTNALASATQILVGYAIGAENYEKAEYDCAYCLKWSLLTTGIICIAALLCSDQLFGIFTTNQKVITIGFYLMLANILVELGRAVNVVFIWSLRGAGDVSFPVFIATCCMWVIAVGGSYIVVKWLMLGIVGVWVVAGIDECVRGVIMASRWKNGKWKMQKI